MTPRVPPPPFMRLEPRFERQFRGFELEEECIGHKIDWSEILKQKRIPEEGLSRKQWERIIQELYPLDPQSPKKKWSKDLFDFVADKLNLDIEEPEGLYFYNALGSGLDRKGADCFFVFKNPNTKKEAVFKIDITANPKKDEPDAPWRADLIINRTPDYRSNPEDYVQEMDKIAAKIAERLKEKTELIH